MKLITVSLLTLTLLTANIDMPKEDLGTQEVKKVKNFYKKYLQKSCGYTAANFAQMHTQKEWKNLQKNKKFIDEVLKTCPSATTMVAKILIKDKGKEAFNYLVRFSIQYAKGSGKFPPC